MIGGRRSGRRDLSDDWLSKGQEGPRTRTADLGSARRRMRLRKVAAARGQEAQVVQERSRRTFKRDPTGWTLGKYERMQTDGISEKSEVPSRAPAPAIPRGPTCERDQGSGGSSLITSLARTPGVRAASSDAGRAASRPRQGPAPRGSSRLKHGRGRRELGEHTKGSWTARRGREAERGPTGTVWCGPAPTLECAPPRGGYIRKTPKRVSRGGALRAAESPSASTVRVSAGSMIPSSQRRALA